jgi:ADP-ribose pyrophosphatase
MNLTYNQTRTERKFDGSRVKIDIETVETKDSDTGQPGKTFHFQVAVVKDVVGMVVVNIKTNKVVLNENYRHPTRKRILEVVAGQIDAGETEEQAVLRETLEETGMIGGSTRHLGSFYTSPGLLTEKCGIWVCYATPGGEKKQEDMEKDIKQVEFSNAQLMNMLNEGKIEDMKTAYALTKYILHLA